MVKICDLDSKKSILKMKDIKKILLVMLILLFISIVFWQKSNIFSAIKEISPKQYVIIKNYQAPGNDIAIITFPTLNINLKGQKKLKLGLSAETYNINEIKTILKLTPKINDIVITHITELYWEEIDNMEDLYHLKEELLYRINLVTYPISISTLNFNNFELIDKTP